MPMPYAADPTWVATQYRDACNLEARIPLYALFSTIKYAWHRWILNQFSLPAVCQVLELGCGDGTLRRLNLERMGMGWDITLSDRSPGMVRAARRTLSGTGTRLAFAMVDAQEIPFPAKTFDAVIAITKESGVFCAFRPDDLSPHQQCGPSELRGMH